MRLNVYHADALMEVAAGKPVISLCFFTAFIVYLPLARCWFSAKCRWKLFSRCFLPFSSILPEIFSLFLEIPSCAGWILPASFHSLTSIVSVLMPFSWVEGTTLGVVVSDVHCYFTEYQGLGRGELHGKEGIYHRMDTCTESLGRLSMLWLSLFSLFGFITIIKKDDSEVFLRPKQGDFRADLGPK